MKDVATGFTIGCSVDEALKMTVDFDAEAEQTSTAASSPTYPTSADPLSSLREQSRSLTQL